MGVKTRALSITNTQGNTLLMQFQLLKISDIWKDKLCDTYWNSGPSCPFPLHVWTTRLDTLVIKKFWLSLFSGLQLKNSKRASSQFINMLASKQFLFIHIYCVYFTRILHENDKNNFSIYSVPLVLTVFWGLDGYKFTCFVQLKPEVHDLHTQSYQWWTYPSVCFPDIRH